jgi:hypothetical protein
MKRKSTALRRRVSVVLYTANRRALAYRLDVAIGKAVDSPPLH